MIETMMDFWDSLEEFKENHGKLFPRMKRYCQNDCFFGYNRHLCINAERYPCFVWVKNEREVMKQLKIFHYC